MDTMNMKTSCSLAYQFPVTLLLGLSTGGEGNCETNSINVSLKFSFVIDSRIVLSLSIIEVVAEVMGNAGGSLLLLFVLL